MGRFDGRLTERMAVLFKYNVDRGSERLSTYAKCPPYKHPVISFQSSHLSLLDSLSKMSFGLKINTKKFTRK